MPAVTRLGDNCTGHGCYGGRPNSGASPNVFTNSIPTHRQTDPWSSHCCGPPCHGSATDAGSPTVYVNSLQIARIGDPVACGSAIAEGSGNVFAGNSGNSYVFPVFPPVVIPNNQPPSLKEGI